MDAPEPYVPKVHLRTSLVTIACQRTIWPQNEKTTDWRKVTCEKCIAAMMRGVTLHHYTEFPDES